VVASDLTHVPVGRDCLPADVAGDEEDILATQLLLGICQWALPTYEGRHHCRLACQDVQKSQRVCFHWVWDAIFACMHACIKRVRAQPADVCPHRGCA